MRARTRTAWIVIVAACALASTLLAACGDDDSAKSPGPTVAATSPTAAPASPTTGPTINGVPIVKQIPAADLNKLTLPAAPQAILKIAPVQIPGGSAAVPGLLLTADATIYAPIGGTFVSADTGATYGSFTRDYSYKATDGSIIDIFVSGRSTVVVSSGPFNRGDALMRIQGDAQLDAPSTAGFTVFVVFNRPGKFLPEPFQSPNTWVSGVPAAFVP